MDCVCKGKAPFRQTTVRSVSLAVSGKRFVNVVNRAKDNGSALVRRLGNLLRPSIKGIAMSNISLTRGAGRTVIGHRSMNVIFRCPRRRLFRRAMTGSVTFNPRGRNYSRRRARGQMGDTVHFTKVSCRAFTRQSPFHLSNNRRHHITVTNIVTVRPSFLVLSRPSTKLSPIKQQRVFDHVRK